jgi:hypothetical protein
MPDVKTTRFLELRHKNGDWREVLVVRAERPAKLIVRWPLGGMWELDLRKNVLRGAEQWGAFDMKWAWRLWLEMVSDRKPTETLETVMRAIK